MAIVDTLPRAACDLQNAPPSIFEASASTGLRCTVQGEDVPSFLQVLFPGLQHDRTRPTLVVDRGGEVLGFQTHGVVPRVRPVGGICEGRAEKARGSG